eukprot:6173939-Pleurochrysis_carterae.AAC.2
MFRYLACPCFQELGRTPSAGDEHSHLAVHLTWQTRGRFRCRVQNLLLEPRVFPDPQPGFRWPLRPRALLSAPTTPPLPPQPPTRGRGSKVCTAHALGTIVAMYADCVVISSKSCCLRSACGGHLCRLPPGLN